MITDWDCVEDEIAKMEEKGVEVCMVEPNPHRTEEQPREPENAFRKDDVDESKPDQRTETSKSDS